MAAGSLLGVVAGEETAVATLTVVAAVAAMAAVAAVAGDGTRITTDEGDRHEGEKHRNCNTEKTLHHIPPVREPNASCVPEAVTKQPRSGTATGPQQTNFLRIPVAGSFQTTDCTPWKRMPIGERLLPRESGGLG